MPETLEELIADSKCIQSCLPKGLKVAVSIQAVFEIIDAGGTIPPGGGGLTCAVTDITDGGGDTFDCYEDGEVTT